MDQWKRSKPRGAPLKCPMCRQRFEDRCTYSFPEITPKAFRLFREWLRLTYIPTRSLSYPKYPPDFVGLVEAYQLGIFVSEPEFCKAALQTILRECMWSTEFPNHLAIQSAYAIRDAASPLRELLLEMYMQLSSSDLDKVYRNWSRFPRRFQMDLTKALMQEHDRQQARVRDWASILRKLLNEDQDTVSGGEEELPSEDEEATGGFAQNGS